MAEFVTIRHPSLPEAKPGRVTKRAFELVHEPKGWEVVNEGDAPATTTTTAVASLSIGEQIRRAKAAQAEKAQAEKAQAETPPSGIELTGQHQPLPDTGSATDPEASAPAETPKPAKRAGRAAAADGQEG